MIIPHFAFLPRKADLRGIGYFCETCYNLRVMNRPIRSNSKHISSGKQPLRFLAGVFLALTVFHFNVPFSYAEDALFSLGSCSDEVLRVETRLSDLGYSTCVVNGRWEQSDADALAAFAAANNVSVATVTDALFSSAAVPAAQKTGGVFATGTGGFVLTYGSLMPWSEAKTLLQPGASYNITSCYSGITLHMVCVSLGSHAKFKPELEWDNATLRGFFSSASSSEKQPILVTVNGVLIAASIQQAAPEIAAEDGQLPEYSVYFHNALSAINGIPDVEHETVIRVAANQ